MLKGRSSSLLFPIIGTYCRKTHWQLTEIVGLETEIAIDVSLDTQQWTIIIQYQTYC